MENALADILIALTEFVSQLVCMNKYHPHTLYEFKKLYEKITETGILYKRITVDPSTVY